VERSSQQRHSPRSAGTCLPFQGTISIDPRWIRAKAVGVLLEQLAKVYLGPQFHHSALYDITYHGTLFDDGGALSDPRVLDVVVPAIEELARQNWHAAGALRSVLATWLARRPAGDRLSEPG
jgi:hypothetical protein